MMQPLVSIIIPVMNGGNYMRNAIDSAIGQTYEPIEILVVNDGSDDENLTQSIAVSYGKRIRYFAKKNGGVASALNLGISEMRGELFSWLSHDDEYLPEKIESQVEYLYSLGNRNAIVYSDYETIDEPSKIICTHSLPYVAPESFRLWITKESLVNGCTMLIPRFCFDRVGIFDESLVTTQDYDLWFRLAEQFPFYRLPKVLVRSRIHEEQATRRMARVVGIECSRMRIDFLEKMLNRELSTTTPLSERLRHVLSIARSFDNRGDDVAYRRAVAEVKSISLGGGAFRYIWSLARLPWMQRITRRVWSRIKSIHSISYNIATRVPLMNTLYARLRSKGR